MIIYKEWNNQIEQDKEIKMYNKDKGHKEQYKFKRNRRNPLKKLSNKNKFKLKEKNSKNNKLKPKRILKHSHKYKYPNLQEKLKRKYLFKHKKFKKMILGLTSKSKHYLQKKTKQKWKWKYLRGVKKMFQKIQKLKQKKKNKKKIYLSLNNNKLSKDQEKLNQIYQLLQMQMYLRQEWLTVFLWQILQVQWIFIWKEQHIQFKCQQKELNNNQKMNQ